MPSGSVVSLTTAGSLNANLSSSSSSYSSGSSSKMFTWCACRPMPMISTSRRGLVALSAWKVGGWTKMRSKPHSDAQ